MIGACAAQRDLAVRRTGGDQKSRRFDAVRNHFMLRAVQFFHARDCNRRTARAGNVRAHRVQEICQIYNFRFARRAFNNRHAAGQRRRHHHVRRAKHR